MDYSKLIIKRIRETLLLSQEELASKLGVSFATINRWGNGHNILTIKARRKIRDFCARHKIEHF